MSDFKSLGLSAPLGALLAEKGYSSPTEIQEKAIPLILEGRDILACAPTGTGKTAAFSLPMIEILGQSKGKARVPRSLIITPTRELAAQVSDNFQTYAVHNKLQVVVLIGGESIVRQKALLNKGVDVLIATPGRFLDLYQSGQILPTGIQMVVLDECDRMMDMGFMPSIKKIMAILPAQKQTILLSATMAPEIKTIAREFLVNPAEITVSRLESSPKLIDQKAVAVVRQKPEKMLDAKMRVLLPLLKQQNIESSIIFCNRKVDVDRVYALLKKKGHTAAAIHGDYSQDQRHKAIARLKSGAVSHLVASDVAARGIDIADLSYVINFDVPLHIEDYVHRIGRTGRAGSKGHSFTLVAKEERDQLALIEKYIKAPIPFFVLDGVPAPAEKAPEPERPASAKNHLPREKRRDPSRRPAPKREESLEHSPAPTKTPEAAPQDSSAPSSSFGENVPAFLLKKTSKP